MQNKTNVLLLSEEVKNMENEQIAETTPEEEKEVYNQYFFDFENNKINNLFTIIIKKRGLIFVSVWFILKTREV